MASSNLSTSLSSCPVLALNLTESPAVSFRNTPSIVAGHEDTPRMGHSHNITQALTGTDAQAQDYLIGLLSASIVMFVFFSVWLAVVLAFKCAGYRRVGFCSGTGVGIPLRPSEVAPADEHNARSSNGAEAAVEGEAGGEVSESTQTDAKGQGAQPWSDEAGPDPAPYAGTSDAEIWEKLVRRREQRIRNIRIAVLLSGTVIVVGAILMLVYGVRGLNRSVGFGHSGLDQGESLATSGVNLIDSFLERQNATLMAAQAVQEASNVTLCPQVKSALCSNSAEFNCGAIFGSLPTFLSDLAAIATQMSSTRSDLTETASLINNANQKLSSFDWAFWVAAGAVILLIVCTLVIMNGVLLAWRNKLHGTAWQRVSSRLRTWFVVPLFVILLIIGWIFSMVFVIGSAATADFCYDSPDNNMVAILDKNRDLFSSSSTVFPALVYYVSGCPQNSTANPLAPLNVTSVFEYLEVAYAATVVVANQSEAIATECNEDPATLQASLAVLQAVLCGNAESVYNLTEYFSCQNFNGLYATVAYDAVCYNGNGGLVWVATTQFVVLVCAMIMLTLRAAFYETVDESQLLRERGGRYCFPRCCRGSQTRGNPAARAGAETGAQVGNDRPVSEEDGESPAAVWKGSDDGESLYLPEAADNDPPKGLL